MMTFLKSFKSIKYRLVVFFLIFAISPALIIGSISYYISAKVIEEKASKSSVKMLTHIRNNIEKQMEALVQVADMIFVNKEIKRILSTQYSDDINFKLDMMEVESFYSNFSYYSVASKYISSIILFGNNNRELAIGEDAHTVPRQMLLNGQMYKDAVSANGKIVWSSTHVNWAEIWGDKYVISLARLIKDERQNSGIGVAFISYKESAISDLYKNIELGNTGTIYIIDGNGRVISHSDRDLLMSDFSVFPHIKKVMENSTGNILTKKGNIWFLLTYCTSSRNGWKIIEEIPLNELIDETNIIRNVTVGAIIVCILMGFVFSWFISESVTRPIEKLRKTMKKIEDGNLEVKADDSSEDEVGQLSYSFNYMIQKTKELFQRIIEEQANKKDAEYRALVSQVNPHFLYNTLNSIKWMATIQKADGIRDMVSALGRMLQKSVKGLDVLITIKEEIEIISDYIFIQRFRYKDKFDVKYDIHDDILEYKTPKFILQPIIENAIFHGLEPMEGLGTIKIGIKPDESTLRFLVEDNGAGMSEEQIENILGGGVAHSRGFSAIGIKNVDDRIKQLFGNNYGVSIMSRLGEYTRVEIVIPAIKEGMSYGQET